MSHPVPSHVAFHCSCALPPRFLVFILVALSSSWSSLSLSGRPWSATSRAPTRPRASMWPGRRSWPTPTSSRGPSLCSSTSTILSGTARPCTRPRVRRCASLTSVAPCLPPVYRREHAVREVLGRALLSDEDEAMLTDRLRVPKEWIAAAKVRRPRNETTPHHCPAQPCPAQSCPAQLPAPLPAQLPAQPTPLPKPLPNQRPFPRLQAYRALADGALRLGVELLLDAGLDNEAHARLIRTVAPSMLISGTLMLNMLARPPSIGSCMLNARPDRASGLTHRGAGLSAPPPAATSSSAGADARPGRPGASRARTVLALFGAHVDVSGAAGDLADLPGLHRHSAPRQAAWPAARRRTDRGRERARATAGQDGPRPARPAGPRHRILRHDRGAVRFAFRFGRESGGYESQNGAEKCARDLPRRISSSARFSLIARVLQPTAWLRRRWLPRPRASWRLSTPTLYVCPLSLPSSPPHARPHPRPYPRPLPAVCAQDAGAHSEAPILASLPLPPSQRLRHVDTLANAYLATATAAL